MNLAKPDKGIFASRLPNLVRRPRLASKWRQKPKEKFRYREEGEEACGGKRWWGGTHTVLEKAALEPRRRN